MSCRGVKKRLSEYLDGDLSSIEAQALRSHLEDCARCADHLRSLEAALMAVRSAPRLQARSSIAARVLHQLEVESRGPGLALLFRPAWKARPLIFPSLVPAVLVLVSILAGVLALDREPREAVVVEQSSRWETAMAPSGTEANPLFLSANVTSPRIRNAVDLDSDILASLGQDSLFIETIVARDGSVSAVTVLGGDTRRNASIVDVLRQERFEPGRYQGRPVAVSIYRLISALEVSASRT